MTPEQRLEGVRQQIEDGHMAELDPSSVAVMQLYYVIALSLSRLADHFDLQQGA